VPIPRPSKVSACHVSLTVVYRTLGLLTMKYDDNKQDFEGRIDRQCQTNEYTSQRVSMN
jgi:hypothetical protein